MSNISSVCGIDEVGRGALAGPLIAVAAHFKGIFSGINTEDCPIEGVNDSKKLNPKKRQEVFFKILRHPSLADFGIGEVSVEEINKYGIVWANEIAFSRALNDLNTKPSNLIIDGTSLVHDTDIPQICKPKADALYWPVGAASILAKVIRDNYMGELAEQYPHYLWDSNAGYGSAAHKEALKSRGACALHRSKFVEGLL